MALQHRDTSWPHLKAELELKGESLSALAIRHGYDASYLRQTKRHALPAAQQIIADALGVPPQKIWPSRYDHRGRPLTHRQWQRTLATGRRCTAHRRAA